jgi:DNA-directed RNA polymerase specialized sigma24 family protein
MDEDHGWEAFLAANKRALERDCHRNFRTWSTENVDDAIQDAWINVQRHLSLADPHYQIKQVGDVWCADDIDNLAGYFVRTVRRALTGAHNKAAREVPTDFGEEDVKQSGSDDIDEFLAAESLVILKENLQRHPEYLASGRAIANGDPYDHKNAEKVVLHRILTEIANSPDGEIPDYAADSRTLYDTVKTYLEEECPYYFTSPQRVVGKNTLGVRRLRGKDEVEKTHYKIFENYGGLQDVED